MGDLWLGLGLILIGVGSLIALQIRRRWRVRTGLSRLDLFRQHKDWAKDK